MEKPGLVSPLPGAGTLKTALLFFVLLSLQACTSNNSHMETRTTVKGILHDASGKPVSNAIVMIAQGRHPHHDIASVTNDSGEFYLSDIVVPGDYVLLIKTDSGSRQQSVSLTGDEQIQLQY